MRGVFYGLEAYAEHVVIDFKNARVVDHFAIVVIDSLDTRYRAAGKKLHLKHLGHDGQGLLGNAKDMIEVNLLEDPKYCVSDDKLA